MRKFNLLLFIVIQIVPKIFGSITEDELEVFPHKVDYKTAVELCKLKGMNLIKIQDDETNKLVFDFANNKNLTRFWIDGNDIEKEGEWKYSDGSKMTYSKWEKGEPSNDDDNEDCIEGNYFVKGSWNDIVCAIANAVICYKEKPASNFFRRDLIGAQDTDLPVIITIQRESYDEAVHICQSNNYILLRIDNEKNDRSVHKLVSTNTIGSYWIDGVDRYENGTFIDSAGQQLKYNNFEPGRNVSSESGHCISGSEEENTYWNIVPCNSINTVLCLDPNVVRDDV